MSPLDIDLGVDLDVVDEPLPANPTTATDTGFLLAAIPGGEPQTVQQVLSPAQARTKYPTATSLHTLVDGYFGAGGGRLYVAPLGADELVSANLFGPQLGPGQLMAPAVVSAADQVNLRDWGWANNRVYVAQAPDGASNGALNTLAQALIDDAGGRYSMLEADTILIPGLTPGTTRECPASVIKAALMARSDRVTGNPNLAAAGNHTPGASGVVGYAVGIKGERSIAAQKTLATQQVNCFRTVNGVVRSYGYWTLADLDVLPQWWDMGGSRTVMFLRAQEEAIAEEMMFGQIAADGAFLDKYKGALSGALAEMQRIGALFGTAENRGYSVNVTADMNPVSNVAHGIVASAITLRTSPFAAELPITLTRRAITESVA